VIGFVVRPDMRLHIAAVTLLSAALAGGGSTARSEHGTSGVGASMFRGDAGHTGGYSDAIGHELAGVQWIVNTGGGGVPSPAVLGDTVWIGSADGTLRALDRLTGSVRWIVDLHSPISSTPAVTDGRVIVDRRAGAIHSRRGQRAGVRRIRGRKAVLLRREDRCYTVELCDAASDTRERSLWLRSAHHSELSRRPPQHRRIRRA
jgi:PQQ-like domain